jgi:hypothetical protein
MTSKEKLRARVEDLTEQEAEANLDFIAGRGSRPATCSPSSWPRLYSQSRSRNAGEAAGDNTEPTDVPADVPRVC